MVHFISSRGTEYEVPVITAFRTNNLAASNPRGGVLPYMGHIAMCRCEGYVFQAVYSSIGYINQSGWVWDRLSFFTKLTSWLKILSRLRKPGIATQKYKHMKSASLNFYDSASTALIHDYHKTLLDVINCQKLEFRSDLGSLNFSRLLGSLKSLGERVSSVKQPEFFIN